MYSGGSGIHSDCIVGGGGEGSTECMHEIFKPHPLTH